MIGHREPTTERLMIKGFAGVFALSLSAIHERRREQAGRQVSD